MKKTNIPTEQWAWDINKQFIEEKQRSNKHIKRCSTLLAIREMQIKTITSYLFLSPPHLQKFKSLAIYTTDGNLRKLALLGSTVREQVKIGKSVVFLNVYAFWPHNSTSGFHSVERNNHLYVQIFNMYNRCNCTIVCI